MKLDTDKLYSDLTKGLELNQKEGITYLISEYQNNLENKDPSDLINSLPAGWLEKYINIDENDIINHINQTLGTNLELLEDPKTCSAIWVDRFMKAVDTLINTSTSTPNKYE